MSSAAVIGRQLRRQNTGGGPPPPGKGRPRALSHQPLCTPQQQQQLQGKGGKDEEKEKVGCIQSIRNKVTIECLLLTCKALSGGMILLIIGTTMSVVGFYADTLSTELVDTGNSTVEVTDEERHYHLHNLTYVGPVFMGLGGFVVVAAFVMTFDGHDSTAKVVPIKDDRAAADGALLTSLLVDDHLTRDKQNGPSTSGPYLCVPNPYDIPAELRKPSVTLAGDSKTGASGSGSAKADKKEHTKEKSESSSSTTGTRRKDSQVFQVMVPNGPSKEVKPPPNLSLAKKNTPSLSEIQQKNRERMMIQLCLGDFVPSPQDIEIIDPDGCDTPVRNSCTSSSMDMEVYVSNCPITVRVQVEPRHLASMESDGLSDSDISDPGELARISRRDFDFPEQEMPLLGRCSPAFSSPEPRRAETGLQLFKRDSNRRFPLLGQGALDANRVLDGQSEATLT